MAKFVKQLGSIDRHLDKIEIVDLAIENAQAIVDSGQYDLLKVYVELKRYETYLKGLIQHLKQPTLVKATEMGSKSFVYNQAKVHISTRTKWNFSVDQKWVDLDRQIMLLTKAKKEREKDLKEGSNLKVMVDRETGEIIEDFELPKEIVHGLAIRL